MVHLYTEKNALLKQQNKNKTKTNNKQKTKKKKNYISVQEFKIFRFCIMESLSAFFQIKITFSNVKNVECFEFDQKKN